MALDEDELWKFQWLIMEHVSACSIIPLMRIGDELNLFSILQKTAHVHQNLLHKLQA